MPAQHLRLIEEKGDIFAAPPGTVLIHACNSHGKWGAGIAKAFKDKYPRAYATYAAHCRDHDVEELIGTALLIPPTAGEDHTVGCIFTSRAYGRKKDAPDAILAATRAAMSTLLTQLGPHHGAAVHGCTNRGTTGERPLRELWMCRINSGRFGVPWERTKAVLESIEVTNVGEDGGTAHVRVVSRD